MTSVTFCSVENMYDVVRPITLFWPHAKFLTEVVTISGLNLILKSNVIPELIISLILYISLLVNL